jgi:signal peptidase I
MLLWLKRNLRSALLVVIGLSVLPSYLWAYSLSGASAAPTILLRDTFVVNRAAYDFRLPYSRITLVQTGSPRRGDMVQAQLPAGIGLAIKRVLGLPGETIEVRENRVIINGLPLPAQPLGGAGFAWVPAAHHMGSTVVMEDGHWAAYTPGKSQYRNFPPVRLRLGEYFLIGDNRDNSFDSRAFGPVARERILGKLIAVLPTGPRLARLTNPQ